MKKKKRKGEKRREKEKKRDKKPLSSLSNLILLREVTPKVSKRNALFKIRVEPPPTDF
jgi:hypothetical protein